MVEIYLNMQESEVPFPFLSIPLGDVQRLSIHPFKWLRYVMFSICGAQGDLSTMPEGPAVDYQSTVLVDDVIYYYKPSEICIFVDYEGQNDHLTSSYQSSSYQSDYCANFKHDILVRDGPFCVITRDRADYCDAAHLIPRIKANEYIEMVVRVRSPLYDGMAPVIRGINNVENGVMLTKTVHAMLDEGDVAFLKTPGYGLDPADIHRVDPGPTSTEHFTLQYLKASTHYNPGYAAAIANITEKLNPAVAFALGLNVDALFQGTGSPLPPAVIIDYVYGVAAYNHWKSKHVVHSVMENYHQEHYINILPLPSSPQNNDDGEENLFSLNDNPDDSDFDHNATADSLGPDHPQQRLHKSTKTGDKMSKAMDEMNLVLMLVQGITPQEAANRWEKQREEEELKVQEASQRKVTEWMEAMDIGGS